MSKYNNGKQQFFVILIIIFIIIISIFVYLKFFNKNSNTNTIKPNKETYETSNISTNIFDKNKDVTLTVIDKDGNKITSTQKYNVNSIEDLCKEIEKDIIKKMNQNIDVNILNINIKNGTAYINFDDSIKQLKFNSIEEEKSFIQSTILSLVNNSSEKFSDVQFLLNGKAEDCIFGTINTKRPFPIDSF